MKKAKEFWIDNTCPYEDYITEHKDGATDDCVNVIEKSAYDKAIEALKEIAKERKYFGALPGNAKLILKELGEL